MVDWRIPTEEEAEIILEQEKKKVSDTRKGLVVQILCILGIVLLLLGANFVDGIDKRTKEILGYDPRTSKGPVTRYSTVDDEEAEERRQEQEEEMEQRSRVFWAMRDQDPEAPDFPQISVNPELFNYLIVDKVDEEEKEAQRERQEKEVQKARAEAAGDVLPDHIPAFVFILSLAVGAYLICFYLTRNNLRDVIDRKYEVATGKFDDKSFLKMGRYRTQYFVVARFDDDSTLEGQVTQETFEKATASTSILMVARKDPDGEVQVFRTYVC
ncbi:MAG: hypothetical protein GXY75_00965 [Bacteroidales bacterium]|nr:hypothetical protein [Bacteroidales bacterium]